MLPWMKYLCNKLSSSSTEFNTKLFIARLVVNAEEVCHYQGNTSCLGNSRKFILGDEHGCQCILTHCSWSQ